MNHVTLLTGCYLSKEEDGDGVEAHTQRIPALDHHQVRYHIKQCRQEHPPPHATEQGQGEPGAAAQLVPGVRYCDGAQCNILTAPCTLGEPWTKRIKREILERKVRAYFAP